MSVLDITFTAKTLDDGFTALGWQTTIGGDELGNSVRVDWPEGKPLPGLEDDVMQIVLYNAMDTIANFVFGKELPILPEEPTPGEALEVEGFFHKRQLIGKMAEKQFEDRGWEVIA